MAFKMMCMRAYVYGLDLVDPWNTETEWCVHDFKC